MNVQTRTPLLKSLILSVAEALLGSHHRLHRIPFGPNRGSYIYISPQQSLRMYLGVDEPWIAQLATRFVGRDDIVYDIGAHIGYTVLLFAKGSPKFIEAFEMLPPTASALERTIAGNGLTMARVHTVGLGSRRATLELPVWRSMTSMYFEAVAGEPTARCEVVRLDDLVEEHGLPLPTFVKMDVEQAEIDVLEGGRDTFERSRPRFAIEFHDADLLRRGWALLRSWGYSLETVHGPLSEEFVTSVRYFHESVLCLPETRPSAK